MSIRSWLEAGGNVREYEKAAIAYRTDNDRSSLLKMGRAPRYYRLRVSLGQRAMQYIYIYL